MARGLSARTGPPPDPNALKSSGDWFDLPPEGRLTPAPEWPLSPRTSREFTLWEAEWRRPQAFMWEMHHQEVEVALYVRSLANAERLDASTPARTLVRQQMESLGISLPGLLRNRWRIAAPTVVDEVSDFDARPSVRDRLKAVGDGFS